MSDGMDRASYFGYGLLAGAAIGLAIGLMYAPKSGKETRAIIKEKTDEWVDEAKEKYERAKDRVTQMAHRKEKEAEA